MTTLPRANGAPRPGREARDASGPHGRLTEKSVDEEEASSSAPLGSGSGLCGEDTSSRHRAVMVTEVLEMLRVEPGGRYIDGTLGFGGHTQAIMGSAEHVSVLGIDRDGDAVEACRQRLERQHGPRVRCVRGAFGDLDRLARECAGWGQVDGVLLDLGVSSYQLDTPARGFSHRADGPLDMRMDRRSPVTAAVILNRRSEDELAQIFREYGEERRARGLARAVVDRREARPWERTGEFAELVTRVVGRTRRGRLPDPTRCFMALRMAVNDELGELRRGLVAALSALRPGGRLVVISFHSLEDRTVKRFFVQEALSCVCPAWFPECRCDKKVRVRVLTRRPMRPGAAELAGNTRASPARLRAAEKVEGAETAA